MSTRRHSSPFAPTAALRAVLVPAAFAIAAGACGGPSNNNTGDAGPTPDASDAAPAPRGLAVLGRGTHDVANVRVRVIATQENHLNAPRDLAFNPEAPEQLWVTNFADDSITIIRNPGEPTQDASHRAGPGNTHFLTRPAALAFGAPGFLATAHEQDEITQRTTPATFMGPSLWTSDYELFEGGDASHRDMLHNSPNAVGIAWETAHVYWVVDGAHNSLTRYDFREPHELGGVDHQDGDVKRYAEGEIAYVEGVSSHAEWDRTTNRLFVADTGNNRIAALDPAPAVRGTRITPNYDGTTQFRMTGASVATIVDGAAAGLQRPSGLAIVGDTIYVTDNATSRVYAFDRMGATIDYLDLSSQAPAGALMGIAFDARGRIYLTDAVNHRVLEVSPAGQN